MKKMLAALAVAATTVAGLAAVPTVADAQPNGYGPRYDYGRPYRGEFRGPRYNAYRRGYYARYNRNPRRVCETGRRGRTVCFYR